MQGPRLTDRSSRWYSKMQPGVYFIPLPLFDCFVLFSFLFLFFLLLRRYLLRLLLLSCFFWSCRYRQVLEEIKTEEEVKRVCSGFGDSNASDYGPTPTDSGNVYGPGAGLAAKNATTTVAASAAASAVGASGPPGVGTPSWAATAAAGGAAVGVNGSAAATAFGAGGEPGGNAAKIVAQISAQVRGLAWRGGGGG